MSRGSVVGGYAIYNGTVISDVKYGLRVCEGLSFQETHSLVRKFSRKKRVILGSSPANTVRGVSRGSFVAVPELGIILTLV